MEKLIYTFIGLIGISLVGFIGFSVFNSLAIENTVTCTVESKERAISGDSSTKLIYTEECGVLSVDDTVLHGKFNSADTYGAIKEGSTYVFETRGARNGFFSMFPNIIEMQEVTQ